MGKSSKNKPGPLLEHARNLYDNITQLLKEAKLKPEFLQSDLFTELEQGQKFDMLVSNPPYIRSDVIPTLMEEVKSYEPIGALDGMEDGLYFYREISHSAKPYLYRGATLFFEIGYDQAEAVSRILEKDGYKEIEIIIINLIFVKHKLH